MKLFLFTLISISASVFAGQNLKPVYNHYSELQTYLAQDNLVQAKKAAGQMLSSVNDVKAMQLEATSMQAWHQQGPGIKSALVSAVKVTSIEELRVQFNLLSKSIIALGLANAETGLNQFHCPMAFGGKGADWLQKGNATMNPFYGASMLKCGSMVKSVAHSEPAKMGKHKHSH